MSLKPHAYLEQVQNCKMKYKAELGEHDRLSMVYNREEIKSILGRGII